MHHPSYCILSTRMKKNNKNIFRELFAEIVVLMQPTIIIAIE
jgi:hypothetical protein